MRRILSVTGVLCLLMAGVAWAQTDEGTAKSGHLSISGMLAHLSDPDTHVHTRMLRSLGLPRRDRFHIAVYTKDPGRLQTVLDPYGQACRQLSRSLFYCSNLTPAQIERIDRADAGWIGLQPLASVRRGSVTSAGDDAHGAADFRARLGVDGNEVNIGVISDGLVNLQASVDSGDLPDNVQIVNGRNGDDENNSDEGRAMAEIIHDLAPGANLFFHSGFPSSLDMIEAIEALTAAGAHIIVDDLGFLGEPVFEDGPIAQAVQTAVDSGVVYVTSAGNSAMDNYHAMYRELNPNDGIANRNEHDFGGGDRTMAITVAPGGLLFVFLQWADRFDGLSGTADYDLHLLDASENVSPCTLPGLFGFCDGADAQLQTAAPPLEQVALLNTRSEAVTVNVMINRYAGEALPLQLLFNGGGFTIDEHNVASSSIFGHACVSDALAIGAIDANDPGFDTIEGFSSQGPCNIYFPTRQTRFKPDVAGADGVNTSLPFFTPFFGTSAAAPHIAAIAALLIELGGGLDEVSPPRIRNIVRLGTTDLGVAGPDHVYGFGVVEAQQAANVLQAAANTAPQSVIESPADDIVIAPGEQPLFQGTCIDAEDPEVNEDGTPFTFAWDFGGVAAASTLQNPSAPPFTTPGTFTISFTCTDANGLSDPTPDSRTITVNVAPRNMITSHGDSVIVEEGSQLNFTGVCDDPENNTPYSYLWRFNGGADRTSSTEQNPSRVRYDTPGDYLASFRCNDAFGSEALASDFVRVLVNPRTSQAGGGGGCSLVSNAPTRPLDALGNMGLPLLVITLIWTWRRRSSG